MIKENTVVSMNYTLKDEEGTILDSSEGQPLDFLQGHHNIIRGLEKAVTGLAVGDKKQVVITPEEGYGQYNPELQFSLPMEQFQGGTPEPGMMIQLSSRNGQNFLARVIAVQNNLVTMDANHPLAGQNLYFDIEITGIREATPEEIAHGHPHGPNGHHH